jgi:uncharacterized protein (DUF58 family)
VAGRLLLGGFRLVHRAGVALERRLTPAGSLAVYALLATGALGVDTRRSLAYQAFALLAGLLLVSLVASRVDRLRLAGRRMLPAYATAGSPLTYRVQVRNLSRRSQADLWLEENLACTPPSVRAFRQAHAPGEEGRNWFDRRVGYPRWAWMLRQSAGAEIAPRPLPALAPGADPLGLCNARARTAGEDRLLVLPRRYPLPALDLPGGRRYQRGGVSLASHVGDAEEFLSLREYRPGDPLRHIHWRSWARTGRPIVKELQDEFFVRHALVLDTFAAGVAPERFEEAVSVAASFAAGLRSEEALLDLLFVGGRVYCQTAGRGLAGTEQLLEVLACVEPCLDRPLSDLADAVLGRAGGLSGCVLVLLRWDAPRQDLAARLQTLGVAPLVLVVGASTDTPAGPLGGGPGRVVPLPPDRIGEALARL